MKKIAPATLLLITVFISTIRDAIAANTSINLSDTTYVAWVEIPNSGSSSSLDFTTGDFTLEAWVRPWPWKTTNTSFEHTIMGNDDQVNGGGYVLRAGGSHKLSFAFYNGSVWQEVATDTPVLKPMMWQHVAVTKSNGNVVLYVNGIIVASNVFTNNFQIASSSKKLKIGANGSLEKRGITGAIDEVKIWNTSRTQQQVKGDAYEICGNMPTGLLALYKFDDTAGQNLTVKCANNPFLNGLVTNFWNYYTVTGTFLADGNITALYVDSSHTSNVCGTKVGDSWNTALSDLSEALHIAASNPQIKTIHIAKGTYYPSKVDLVYKDSFKIFGGGFAYENYLSTHNRYCTFYVANGVKIMGGYPSGGGVRNPSINPTILDGSKTAGKIGDTAFNVLYVNTYDIPSNPHYTDTSGIYGLVIRNAANRFNRVYPQEWERLGSGISCHSRITIIEDCIFENLKGNIGAAIGSTGIIFVSNNLFTSSTGKPNDGGIYLKGNRGTINNNKFYNCGITGVDIYTYIGIVYQPLDIYNNEISGGDVGINVNNGYVEIKNNYIHDLNATGIVIKDAIVQLPITGNKISDNHSLSDAGGIFIEQTSSPITIDSNIISRNSTSDHGGGIFCHNTADARIINNTISFNNAFGGGGVVANNGTVYLAGNTIKNNTAQWRGGIRLSGATYTIINNTISNNEASIADGAGTAIAFTDLLLANNVISGNSAPINGGLHCYTNTRGEIFNNTFYNNVATDSTTLSNSGALKLTGYAVTVGNNIFFKNRIASKDTTAGADFIIDGSIQQSTFYNNILQRPETSYSYTASGPFAIGVNAANNVFMADPLFANANNPEGLDGIWATGDDGLQTKYGSPALDGGNTTLLPSFLNKDIKNENRIEGSKIDIGAYETGCLPTNFSDALGVCKGSSLTLRVNSSASPLDVNWYADSTTQQVITTGNTLTTVPLQQTDTYWVSVNGCESEKRSPITVQVDTPSIVQLNEQGCDSFYWARTGKTYMNNGIFSDTLYTQYGCLDVATLNLNIYNPPIAVVTKQNHTLYANKIAGNYQWINCNPFTIVSGATDDSLIVTKTGTYAVIVTQNGCSDTSSCIDAFGVGIDNAVSDRDLTIFPNPTTGLVNINLPQRNSTTAIFVRIKNLLGQDVAQYTLNHNRSIIDASNIPSGIYMLEVTMDDKHYFTKLNKR